TSARAARAAGVAFRESCAAPVTPVPVVRAPRPPAGGRTRAVRPPRRGVCPVIRASLPCSRPPQTPSDTTPGCAIRKTRTSRCAIPNLPRSFLAKRAPALPATARSSRAAVLPPVPANLPAPVAATAESRAQAQGSTPALIRETALALWVTGKTASEIADALAAAGEAAGVGP